MSATNGIELEIPWTSSIMRSHLLPHPGCCSLPTAPVVSMLDSSTRRAVDPAILLVHMHACSVTRREWMTSSIWWCRLCLAPCSASGATSLSCAYCQASPAALVPSPSPGVPLSNWNHPILTCIHGDTNFQRLIYSSMLFTKSISIDLRSRVECSHGGQNVSETI